MFANRLAIALGLAALFCLPAKAQSISGGISPISPLYVTGVSVGNGADTTEDTLQSYTLPANTLANVGDRIHILASGTYGATTDTKTVRVRVGTGTNTTTAPVGNAAGQIKWAVDVTLVKTGSSTQSFYALGSVLNTNNAGTNTGTLAQTDTGTLAIVVSGQNSTNSVSGSIACQYFSVELIRAPPS